MELNDKTISLKIKLGVRGDESEAIADLVKYINNYTRLTGTYKIVVNEACTCKVINK